MGRAGGRLAVWCAVACCGSALAGCGGGRSSSVVAEVSGHAITKASLDHWMRVEAALTHPSEKFGPTLPSGALPDPPRYTACIAFLKRTAEGFTIDRGIHTVAGRRAECRSQYKGMRWHVLSILVSFQWVLQEAELRGVTVSEDEVARSYKRLTGELFGSEAALRAYLRYTTLTPAEELFRVKISMLAERLQNKLVRVIAANKGESLERAVGEYAVAFNQRWKTKTTCRPAYVIPDCREYKGTQPPESSL